MATFEDNAVRFGWKGVLLKNDVLELFIGGPGGRIASLKLEGEELLYTPEDVKGNLPDLQTNISDNNFLHSLKKELGFQIWGGDKTWLAPQDAWWEQTPPVDLDGREYTLERVENAIRVSSPICRETGITISRQIEIVSDFEIRLDQTITNMGNEVASRGIWDVTQFMRPFDVFIPASRSQIRPYSNEGDSVALFPKRVQEPFPGWTSIQCPPGEKFKFGGPVDQGALLALRNSPRGHLAHARFFSIFSDRPYAHDSMVEVYNSPDQDYLEIEVHSPLFTLQPGESASHRQRWIFQFIPDYDSPDDALWKMAGE